jgi:dihydroorotate dehydrogenase electron transfer subunit
MGHAGQGERQEPVGEQVGQVVSNDRVNAEYRHLVLACQASARPGQFFQLLCPPSGGEAPFLRRPMSVYAAKNKRVEFLYKVTGAGTRGLASLQLGGSLSLVGPLGIGFWLAPQWRRIVLVGRGAGLATLVPLATMARGQGVGVTAILSARTPALVVSEAVLKAAGAEVLTVHDSDGSSDPASVETQLRRLIAQGACDAIFTCGSARLLRLLQRLGKAQNIPGQVALEQQMACGLGMCFCCVREFVDGYRRVCCEGPVFDLQEALA